MLLVLFTDKASLLFWRLTISGYTRRFPLGSHTIAINDQCPWKMTVYELLTPGMLLQFPFLPESRKYIRWNYRKILIVFDIMTIGYVCVCVCVCVCVYWGVYKLGQRREKLKQRSYIWRINIFINLHNDFINALKQIFLWLCRPKFSNCFVS